MRDNPASPAVRIGDLLPAALDRINKLYESAKQRRKELERYASKQPKRIPCPKGGFPHVIDMDESSRESGPAGNWKLVYQPCPKCKMGDEVEWLKRAGVPKRLLEATLENWKPRTEGDRKALAKASEFVSNSDGFLVISGAVGLGKSHLAVGIMRKKHCGRLITQSRLFVKLRDRYHNDYAEDVIEKCKTARLLVLDECGFMTGARDELPAIYEILDYRHGEMLPTVLTTNVQIAKFDEAFGDRIADRLRCHQPFIVLSGESWRGKL